MLCKRIKQFREYNNLQPETLAKVIGIDVSIYEAYESGKAVPDINIITKLAECYKVTLDEFYGHAPRLTLYSNDIDDFENDTVEERILKMSDLSWDEAQLVLYYRRLENKDELISRIIQGE